MRMRLSRANCSSSANVLGLGNNIATGCDGLEGFPRARTIGIASHLAPGLPGRVGDKLRAQASSGVALLGSLSQHRLHIFKKLPDLRFWKTKDHPSQRRKGSI